MEYCDLELPSGTLWAKNNEPECCDINDARRKFDKELPTREQANELLLYTNRFWDYQRSGIIFVSKVNSQTLFFPAQNPYPPNDAFEIIGDYHVLDNNKNTKMVVAIHGIMIYDYNKYEKMLVRRVRNK